MVGPSNLWCKLAVALCILSSIKSTGLLALAREPVTPNHETSERNGIHIFNAIHSAGRQWGSAIYHNGLSFFPAVMPKGTLLYHGAQTQDFPQGAEWMAFEVEHAEAFAFSAKKGAIPQDRRGTQSHPKQKPITPVTEEPEDKDAYLRGYLHTYRANRNLNLLYVDGMSAGKSTMGTLDTQDLVLRENLTSGIWGPFMDELARATSLCDMLTDWGYDGIMRMEIGFEVIYCNFTNGVDRVMMTRSAIHEDKSFESNMHPFQWARAVSERYDGIGGDRIRLDFSSMVSAYFFPVNISNTDPDRLDLHRLAGASLDDWKDIKNHLRNVVTSPRAFTVNWQAVVDMIVARYARRLAFLAASDQELEVYSTELEIATQTYIDAPPLPGDITLQERPSDNQTANALQACTQHYLLSTYLDQKFWSLEDQLIHTAILKVLSDICETLFAARKILDGTDDLRDHAKSTLNNDSMKLHRLPTARKLIIDLKQRLAWTVWRKPQICAVDELLLTVMWPIGNSDDYWNPGCRTIEQLKFQRRGYWKPDFEVRKNVQELE